MLCFPTCTPHPSHPPPLTPPLLPPSAHLQSHLLVPPLLRHSRLLQLMLPLPTCAPRPFPSHPPPLARGTEGAEGRTEAAKGGSEGALGGSECAQGGNEGAQGGSEGAQGGSKGTQERTEGGRKATEQGRGGQTSIADVLSPSTGTNRPLALVLAAAACMVRPTSTPFWLPLGLHELSLLLLEWGLKKGRGRWEWVRLLLLEVLPIGWKCCLSGEPLAPVKVALWASLSCVCMVALGGSPHLHALLVAPESARARAAAAGGRGAEQQQGQMGVGAAAGARSAAYQVSLGEPWPSHDVPIPPPPPPFTVYPLTIAPRSPSMTFESTQNPPFTVYPLTIAPRSPSMPLPSLSYCAPSRPHPCRQPDSCRHHSGCRQLAVRPASGVHPSQPLTFQRASQGVQSVWQQPLALVAGCGACLRVCT
ncbi:unnamed protein product [Closterium sp. NIES-54]